MRTLQVDIEGFDLVLGGGFRLLERVPGHGESATILIRGPAGSGKSIFGTQLAASIARALKTDVAYGCIELLPTELQAQHEGVRALASKETVVILNEGDSVYADPSHVRIYAGLLDLGESGDNVERLGGAVEALLDAANTRAGRKAQVLVIDSLSDGYGLGAKAPRRLADGISKLAADRGLVVILLEEQADEGSSVWGFAVDTVFELKPAEDGSSFHRRFLVPKNRLGPSDPGPHEFTFAQRGGMLICPGVLAYQRPWRNGILRRETSMIALKQAWFSSEFNQIDWLPDFRSTTTAVVGSDFLRVRRLTEIVGTDSSAQPPEDQSGFGPEIVFKIGVTGSRGGDNKLTDQEGKFSPFSESKTVALSWGPSQSGSATLALLRLYIDLQAKQNKRPRRVVIGDLSDARHHAEPKSVVHGISIVASLLRDLKIPLVLYETSNGIESGTIASANAVVLLTAAQFDSSLVRVGVDTFWRSELRTLYPLAQTGGDEAPPA